MARHKLSLDINYVSDWDVQAAIRELFQNAIDHGNWSFSVQGSSLSIISYDTSLELSTLLLGYSKKNNDQAIGKYGEGFKLASLVLKRLGYWVEIHNGKDFWVPKLIDSRTYKTKQLVFDVTHGYFETAQPLTFIVNGLSSKDLEVMHERNLHLEPEVAWQSTNKGVILKDRPGQIFIGGLYVATLQDFKYGYNFKPDVISIDRDRRIVRDFDVAWLTAQMWKATSEYEIVNQLIVDKAPDVKDLTYFTYEIEAGFADIAASAFITEHGEDALPVSSNSELAKAQEENYQKIVLVEPVQKEFITRSTLYITPPPPKPIKTPREKLMEFKIEFWPQMSEEVCEALDILIDEAEFWRKL